MFRFYYSSLSHIVGHVWVFQLTVDLSSAICLSSNSAVFIPIPVDESVCFSGVTECLLPEENCKEVSLMLWLEIHNQPKPLLDSDKTIRLFSQRPKRKQFICIALQQHTRELQAHKHKQQKNRLFHFSFSSIHALCVVLRLFLFTTIFSNDVMLRQWVILWSKAFTEQKMQLSLTRATNGLTKRNTWLVLLINYKTFYKIFNHKCKILSVLWTSPVRIWYIADNVSSLHVFVNVTHLFVFKSCFLFWNTFEEVLHSELRSCLHSVYLSVSHYVINQLYFYALCDFCLIISVKLNLFNQHKTDNMCEECLYLQYNQIGILLELYWHKNIYSWGFTTAHSSKACLWWYRGALVPLAWKTDFRTAYACPNDVILVRPCIVH